MSFHFEYPSAMDGTPNKLREGPKIADMKAKRNGKRQQSATLHIPIVLEAASSRSVFPRKQVRGVERPLCEGLNSVLGTTNSTSILQQICSFLNDRVAIHCLTRRHSRSGHLDGQFSLCISPDP